MTRLENNTMHAYRTHSCAELTASDVVAVLEGKTFAAEVFVGVDLVRVVP